MHFNIITAKVIDVVHEYLLFDVLKRTIPPVFLWICRRCINEWLIHNFRQLVLQCWYKLLLSASAQIISTKLAYCSGNDIFSKVVISQIGLRVKLVNKMHVLKLIFGHSKRSGGPVVESGGTGEKGPSPLPSK